MKKLIFLFFLTFSSSLFSQSIRDRLDDIENKLDDLEQQRLIEQIRRNSEESRRLWEEQQRQRPQINPPIFLTPQNTSDFQYIIRTKSPIGKDDGDGDVLIIKSSIKRQVNSVVNYKTVSLFDKPFMLEGKNNKFKTDYIIETKAINCRNNTSISLSGEFFLRDCSTCSKKKLQYSSKTAMKEFVPIRNNEQEFYEFNFLCR